MSNPTKWADIRITIKPVFSDYAGEEPRLICYRASAGETATDYGRHLGAAEAATVPAALDKLAQELRDDPYKMHAPDEAVKVVYFAAGGGFSECSTSLIDWSFDRATRVADKLVRA